MYHAFGKKFYIGFDAFFVLYGIKLSLRVKNAIQSKYVHLMAILVRCLGECMIGETKSLYMMAYIRLSMKVQLISRADISEGLVYDLWREGHVIYYKGKNKFVFNGMDGIIKTKNYENDVDYYIFDDTLFGFQIEKMREEGKYVVGGSNYGDKLELDRWFFYNEMKKLGVNIPETHRFTKISEGIKFLKENGGSWVFKPSGKWSDNKALTYYGDDLVDFMMNLKERYGDKHDYVLQKYIDGIEVAITGLVVDGKVVGGYFVNFEYKPFMRYSNLNTGEMGTVVRYYQNAGILSEYLDKVASKLENYRCWFDLNGILTEDGKYYVLEPTSRFGIPIMSILHSILIEDIGEFYYSVARGEIGGFKYNEDWFVGIVVAVPPFPYEIPNQWQISQKPIRHGLFANDNIHYYEIMKKGDEFWSSGDTGYVAVVVGDSDTIEKANKVAVSLARRIDIPEKFFRFDIGLDDRVEKFKKIMGGM